MAKIPAETIHNLEEFMDRGCKSIQISGSGIIFEMFLQGSED